MGGIAGIRNRSPFTYDSRSQSGASGASGPSGSSGPSGPSGPSGASGPIGPGSFGNYSEIAVSTLITTENTFVEVTASGTATTEVGTGINSITVKDNTGSSTPTIPVTSQTGSVNFEDPNNLGNSASYATTVYIKTPGGAVTWRFNGTMFKVVAST